MSNQTGWSGPAPQPGWTPQIGVTRATIIPTYGQNQTPNRVDVAELNRMANLGAKSGANSGRVRPNERPSGAPISILITRYLSYKKYNLKKSIFLDLVLSLGILCYTIFGRSFYQDYLFMGKVCPKHEEPIDTNSAITSFAHRIVLFMATMQGIQAINFLTGDKINGAKYLMQIMGLKCVTYWLGQTIALIIVPLILAIPLLVLALYIMGPGWDFCKTLVACVLFLCQLIAYVIAISHFVNSSLVAGFIFVFLQLESWTIDRHRLLVVGETTMSPSANYCAILWYCISPNTALALFLRLGHKLDHVSSCLAPLEDPKQEMISDTMILVAQLCWTIVLIIIASFLLAYNPPRRFGASYWCHYPWLFTSFSHGSGARLWDPEEPNKTRILDKFSEFPNGRLELGQGLNRNHFEPIAYNSGRKLAIHINNVTQRFATCCGKQDNPTVDHVTWNIYRDEITLLVGHSASGKTTLMNLIIGLLQSDEGAVYINGHNVNEASGATLGWCPQYTTLMDYLTVREHLDLFAAIKLGPNYNVEHLLEVAKEMGMHEQLDRRPNDLNEVMKRKLNLALAFLGNSSVLILDEPSSDLDSESRKLFWEAIKRRRINSTILLSTKRMEEADYLGDRVAIMSEGRIICCGSAQFLKRSAGFGSRLRLATSQNYKADKMAELVHKYFPRALDMSFKETIVSGAQRSCNDAIWDLVSVANSDNDYDDHYDKLIALLERLESLDGKTSLGLVSMSLNEFTIEEALIRIAAGNSINTYSMQQQADIEIGHNIDILASTISPLYQYHQQISCCHLFCILFCKFFTYFTNSPIYNVIMRLVLPSLIIVLLSFSLTLDACQFPLDYDGTDKTPMRLSVTNCTAIAAYFDGLTHLSLELIPIRIISIVLILCPLQTMTQECASKFRLVQMTSQANLFIYWLSAYVYDMMWWILYTIVLIMCSTLFMRTYDATEQTTQPSFSDAITSMGTPAYLALIIIMVLYGCSILALTYLVSMISVSTSNAIYRMLAIHCIIPQMDLILIPLMANNEFSQNGRSFIVYITLLLRSTMPTDTFYWAMSNLAYGSLVDLSEDPYCHDERYLNCQEKTLALFAAGETFSIFYPMVAFVCQIVFFVANIVYLEYNRDGSPIWDCCGLVGETRTTNPTRDDRLGEPRPDINLEKARAKAMSYAHDMGLTANNGATNQLTKADKDKVQLVVCDLDKRYRMGATAVNGMSFTVNKGELFGLLGVNGSGKSGTISLLTGELEPDSGGIYFCGVNIANSMPDYRAQLGFQSQQNLQLDMMSTDDALRLIANLRGLVGAMTDRVVEATLRLTELGGWRHKQISHLSEGNKRKLALAMSLIGSPPLLVLDEPTVGIEPMARRKIWNVLSRLRSITNQTIVIASSDTNECDYLCDRLTIISQGNMACVGTVQQVRSQYNQGYVIRIQMMMTTNNQIDIDSVDQYLRTQLENVYLDDKTINTIRYRMEQTKLSRSNIIKVLKKARSELKNSILFSVSDTNLHDILLALSTRQRADGQHIEMGPK